MKSGEETSPERTARRVMRQCERATLATALEGWPYASLVLVATDFDASPILLLSDLAEHTRNLARDPRASLLFDGTAGLADPLTGPRVTVLGEVAASAEERRAARYVARHPSAALYRGFKDFRCYRLTPRRAHLVAGFGRIDWIEPPLLTLPEGVASAFAAAEPGILAHMNGDHAATIDLYAQRLLGASGTGWQMSGVDPEGADLRCGAQFARLPFAAPLGDVESVRDEFVRLAALARA